MLKHWMLLLIVLLAGARAQDEQVYEEDEEDSTMQQQQLGPMVYATGLLPDHRDLKVQLGGPVPVLVGIANLGKETINVSSIGGYFCHPRDPNFFVQNFTRRGYGVAVKPGDVASLEYYFYPSPNMESIELVFVADAVYQVGEGAFYRSVFFNSTVNFIEQPAGLDIVWLVSSALFLGVVAVVGYILSSVFATSPSRVVSSVMRRSSIGGSSSGPKEADLDEYLPEHLKAKKKGKKEN
jgi:hypothetical protein